MKYFEKHVGLQLKEEALLIDGIRKIELARAQYLTQEDEETIADFQRDFIDRDLNLRRTTWKRIEDMFDRHGIKIPVDCSIRQIYRKDEGRWVRHAGNGEYYPNRKCKLSFEDAVFKRQTKRYQAWDKATKTYEDMGTMTKEEELRKELKAIKAAFDKQIREFEDKAGIPHKAEVIDIANYLPTRDSK